MSGPKTVTVTNRADQPLHLGGITVDDAGGAFRIDAGNCTDITLPPGGSCRVGVRFAPARAGPYSGVLSVGVQGVDGRSATTLTGTATDPDTVVVPNVVGLPLSAAQRAVAAAGLRPGAITRKQVPDVAAGTVVDQTPTAGRAATRNQPVDLVVASDQVAVPELIGRTEAEAAARLVKIDGGVSGQMAVGEHISQANVRNDPVTEADRAAVRRLVETLKEQVAAEAPPAERAAALGRLDELGDAVVAETPEVSTLVYVRNWFAKHLPKLAGAVTGLIVHPLVGKVVEAAGDLVAEQFRNAFGGPQAGP